MSCFLFPSDCPPPLSLPHPLSISYPSLCPPEFFLESRTLERDYMGLRRSCAKPQYSIADQNILASLPSSPLIHKSSLAVDPSPLDSALCGSHLKLAPPSSGASDIEDNDADDGEPLSVNIGWPPISSYRRSTTKALVSEKPPCSIETTTPLIVHEAPLIDKEEVAHNNLNVDDDDDDDDVEKYKASALMHMNNMKAPILRKPSHIKVSMDGTPIMRKVVLDTMQGYHHLSLELHKLFRFYKRHLSCDVGAHSCFKDFNGADFILTYKDRDGDWMLVGDTSWEIFTQSAQRIRIMKKVN